jgi:hypothetical protein
MASERKAEWQGSDNPKTMIKVKTTGQILSFEKRHDLPCPSQAPGSTFSFGIYGSKNE